DWPHFDFAKEKRNSPQTQYVRIIAGGVEYFGTAPKRRGMAYPNPAIRSREHGQRGIAPRLL
ncbi:MAG: hypothetical protein AAB899_01240, partial [Patescibacteria group bacterium]